MRVLAIVSAPALSKAQVSPASIGFAQPLREIRVSRARRSETSGLRAFGTAVAPAEGRRLVMLSRSLGIVVVTWLPGLAAVLPLGAAYTVNAIVAGLIATALAALSLAYERARLGVALVGVWVAFSPFVFHSSFTEIVLSVSWGMTMWVAFVGPFSEGPTSTFVGPIRSLRDQSVSDEHVLKVAA
jgi:hypothetical protein